MSPLTVSGQGSKVKVSNFIKVRTCEHNIRIFCKYSFSQLSSSFAAAADLLLCHSTETTREICQMMIRSRTFMSLRGRSHQTPTWTRNVEDDSHWWRKTPYSTVMSMTRTKRCHQSAGEALPPMVRPLPRLKVCVRVCV